MNTRRPRTALAVPVLLLALAGLGACGSDDTAASDSDSSTTSSTSDADDGTGAAEDPDTTSDTTSDTLALTADGTTAGKCAVPSAETLAGFDTAFEGTVTSVDGGVATLAVDEWYAGDEATTVTVTAPSDDMQALLMAVDFQQGGTYLVSAQDERVSLCGFSAEKSPELEAMYAQAFAQ